MQDKAEIIRQLDMDSEIFRLVAFLVKTLLILNG